MERKASDWLIASALQWFYFSKSDLSPQMDGIGGLQLLRERGKHGVIPGLFHSLEEILLVVAPYCKMPKLLRRCLHESMEILIYYPPSFPMKLVSIVDDKLQSKPNAITNLKQLRPKMAGPGPGFSRKFFGMGARGWPSASPTYHVSVVR